MGEETVQPQMRILYLRQNVAEGVKFALAVEEELHEVEYVENSSNLLEKIHTWNPQLIILEWKESTDDLKKVISELRTIMLYSPIIVIVDDKKNNLAIAALNAGADDIVRSSCKIEEFIARMNCQFRNKAIHDSLHKANTKLQELVEIDDLTGLFNMRSIFNKLDYELARGKRYKRSVGVLMLDLDNFKDINDENDHLFGSFVLAEVGSIIKNTMRNVDIAARYGGDEFLIILPEIDMPGAETFAERLRSNIENNEFRNSDYKEKLTISIGLSITSPDGDDIDSRELVRCADRALYHAKESGRNCVKCFNLFEQTKDVVKNQKSYSLVAGEISESTSESVKKNTRMVHQK